MFLLIWICEGWWFVTELFMKWNVLYVCLNWKPKKMSKRKKENSRGVDPWLTSAWSRAECQLVNVSVHWAPALWGHRHSVLSHITNSWLSRCPVHMLVLLLLGQCDRSNYGMWFHAHKYYSVIPALLHWGTYQLTFNNLIELAWGTITDVYDNYAAA